MLIVMHVSAKMRPAINHENLPPRIEKRPSNNRSGEP